MVSETNDSKRAIIKARENGPFLVTGAFMIVDHEGNEIETSSDNVVLCRCGESGMKPFCDGSHRATGESDS